MAFSLDEVSLRLILSLLLAGAIGWQRERAQRPAGLRTHILVGMGATLLTLTSISVKGADPMRLAAGIVTGVGFIGAGTIMRSTPTEVRGLTTAASIWMVAGVGIAVGAGFYWGAVLTTILAFLTLTLLKGVERRYTRRGREKVITVEGMNRPGLLGEVGTLLGKYGIDIKDIELRVEETSATMHLRVEIPSSCNLQEVIEGLQRLGGVAVVELGREE